MKNTQMLKFTWQFWMTLRKSIPGKAYAIKRGVKSNVKFIRCRDAA